MYKPNIEKVDILLKKYINKISFDNYNQLIFPEANNPLSGFNIMGMMKLVGNLSNLMRGN